VSQRLFLVGCELGTTGGGGGAEEKRAK